MLPKFTKRLWLVVAVLYIGWFFLNFFSFNYSSTVEIFTAYITPLITTILLMLFITFKIEEITPLRVLGKRLMVGSITTFIVLFLISRIIFEELINSSSISGYEDIQIILLIFIICITYFMIGLATYLIAKFKKSDVKELKQKI